MTWLSGFVEAHERRFSGPDIPTTIYCISEGDSEPVKIGRAMDITARIWTIRSANWRSIYLCWTAVGRSYHEAAIKRLLAGQQISGEWFKDADDRIKRALPNGLLTAQPLEKWIEALAEAAGYPPFREQPVPRGKLGDVRKPLLWLQEGAA